MSYEINARSINIFNEPEVQIPVQLSTKTITRWKTNQPQLLLNIWSSEPVRQIMKLFNVYVLSCLFNHCWKFLFILFYFSVILLVSFLKMRTRFCILLCKAPCKHLALKGAKEKNVLILWLFYFILSKRATGDFWSIFSMGFLWYNLIFCDFQI